MNTQGHLESNGGIRGHSAGAIYPYIVFQQGKPDQLRHKVRKPDGTIVGDYDSYQEAYEHAQILAGI